MASSQKFLQALFKEGLIAFLAGNQPVKIRFLPPIGCIETHHIEQACDIIDRVIQQQKNET